MFNNLLIKALDLIFPITCFFCHKPGSHLCLHCKVKYFKIFKKSSCHVCHGLLRVPGVYIHRICSKDSSLDGLFASYILNDPLKKYLGQIKYKFNRQMLDALKIDIRQELSNRSFSYDLITYVPLHISRQRWRGFNQAEDIARTIDFKASPLLKRSRPTTPQSQLNRQKRLVNLTNTFRCIDPFVLNKTILICDDVYTTGSTLNACAEVLKSAGARKVYGYTIAIDEFPANV